MRDEEPAPMKIGDESPATKDPKEDTGLFNSKSLISHLSSLIFMSYGRVYNTSHTH